jgi:hypothetical protein
MCVARRKGKLTCLRRACMRLLYVLEIERCVKPIDMERFMY